ncbi:CvpA family protein [Bradyrhizobium sp. 2TAF24]|uniref:CvpA family protein n=1 Tax=Bradyrhizobium sp. 2TAF24 TaxID=3233011 RepID=UPI003F8FDCB9
MPASLNLFDLMVAAAALVAAFTGFRAGLIRSLAMILGYASAMPLVLLVMGHAGPAFDTTGLTRNAFVFFGLFVAAGFLIGSLLQVAVNDLLGPRISVLDRIAGSALGVARVGLVAIALVVVFDRIVPSDRQPAMLRDSRLHPMLSGAGQLGLGALSPEVAAAIDQLKREQKI